MRREKPLYPLIFDTQKTYNDARKASNATPISEVSPGEVVYVSLRFFSTKVYDAEITLADKFHIDYVVRLEYTHWTNKAHRRIQGRIPVFHTRIEFDHVKVLRWGLVKTLGDAILVDTNFIHSHKDVLKLVLDGSTRSRLERLYA